MGIYLKKGTDIWFYDFEYRGKRYARSIGRVNEETAEEIFTIVRARIIQAYWAKESLSDPSLPAQRKLLAGGPRNLAIYCWIYFVYAPEQSLIKIGQTTQLEHRLAALDTSSPAPLYLLGKRRATPQTETRLHERFAQKRSHGEWFRVTAPLIHYIHRYCHKNLPEEDDCLCEQVIDSLIGKRH